MERDVLDDAVALVEDAQHRDALRHRGHRAAVGRLAGLPGSWKRRVLSFIALAARGERERGQQQCGGLLHAYSGIQGS